VPGGAADGERERVHGVVSRNDLLKTDLGGAVATTYRFRFGLGFRPATLRVTGNALYLMDKAGRMERFEIE
jgi:hypothetical protein